MYSIDTKKGLIVISAGTLTDEERKEVDDYVKYSGYETKVIRARKSTTAKINEYDIMEMLKDDKEGVTAYEEAKAQPSKKNPDKEVGFLGGKSWFIENYPDEYMAFLKKTKQTAALESFKKNKAKKKGRK